jgi:LPXTG-motif cell wall-anchored protein
VQVEAMAIAAPVSDGESAAGTVRVESAGADGDRPGHTAQVQSADYDQSQRRAERLPKTATPLPLIAVFGAGLLACGLVLGMWRRRR